ncbi:hypothetical protein HDU96_002936 [Phlyctochytrium bullatum]|nr:hypothetical protein HDU96_002936 [Phlyctochytrium bullatum]
MAVAGNIIMLLQLLATLVMLIAGVALGAPPKELLRCGAEGGFGSCNSTETPCCSFYGFCGAGPEYCGHGCNVNASLDPTSSCYSTRSNSSARSACVSGFYDFTDSTWVIPERAWDGTSDHADWTYQGSPDNLLFGTGTNGTGMSVVLSPPKDKAVKLGSGPYARGNFSADRFATGDMLLTSTSYLNYGKVSARLRSGEGNGVVTSIITMSDDKDEIDWEWTKGDRTAQSNTFSKGVFNSKVGYHDLDGMTSREFHDYAILWLPDRIEWYIDDKLVRTYRKEQGEFPVSRSAVQISIWNGGDSTNGGTSGWAGGPIDWERVYRENRRINATFDWVMIQCLDDLDKPKPTGPPPRKSGRSKPSLLEVTTTITSTTTTSTIAPTALSSTDSSAVSAVTASFVARPGFAGNVSAVSETRASTGGAKRSFGMVSLCSAFLVGALVLAILA